MPKPLILLVALLLTSFSLAACGGDDDDEGETAATTEEPAPAENGGGGGEGETISVSAPADGSLAFEESELTAAAGPATFEFTNPASLAHDFCLEQDGEDLGCTETVADGASSALDAELEAGDYAYYCSVPGHRDGGMEGTLAVE